MIKLSKKYLLLLILAAINISAYCCPVCERSQPKLLRGILHGSGPQSNWEYISVWGMVVITLATLFYSVKWLVKPDENNNNHIKNSIF